MTDIKTRGFPVPDVTLTTACFYVNDATRTVAQAVENITTLLGVRCLLQIYADATMAPLIRKIRCDEHGLELLTNITEMKFEELPMHNLRDSIIENRKIFWPTKDARAGWGSHVVCCSKWGLVHQTMEKNPFKTDKHGWVDASLGLKGTKISHVFQEHEFLQMLNQVGSKFQLMRLGAIDKRMSVTSKEFWTRYRFFACGCLFTLDASFPVNHRILDRLQDAVREAINAGFGHGEEMHYLVLLQEFEDDIKTSYGDYRDLVHNFNMPTRNFDFIWHSAIEPAIALDQHDDVLHACSTLIAAYESFTTPMNWDMYFRLLFRAFIAAFYLGQQPEDYVDKIYAVCEVSREFKRIFDENAGFYRAQLAFGQRPKSGSLSQK